jgi:uncharacterized protein (TIGR03066 family)
MRPLHILRPVLLVAVVCVLGAADAAKDKTASNNKGKIEGTRWSSLAANIKGNVIPAGRQQLDFGKDGSLVYSAGPLTFKGTYELGAGDKVTFKFTQALFGKKEHIETIVIKDDKMTVTDSDGTGLTFEKKK